MDYKREVNYKRAVLIHSPANARVIKALGGGGSLSFFCFIVYLKALPALTSEWAHFFLTPSGSDFMAVQSFGENG